MGRTHWVDTVHCSVYDSVENVKNSCRDCLNFPVGAFFVSKKTGRLKSQNIGGGSGTKNRSNMLFDVYSNISSET